MNVGENQIRPENRKIAFLKSKTGSLLKSKNEISNSFFQRIISLLKKEELI